jgi:hypothetical protein
VIFIPLTVVRVWVTVVLEEHFQDGGANVSLVERQRCSIEFCVRLEKKKVDQKPYNLSTKPVESRSRPMR